MHSISGNPRLHTEITFTVDGGIIQRTFNLKVHF